MQRDLQGRGGLPADGRCLLQRELLQPQQLHRLALAGRQHCDRLMQPANIAGFLMMVRFIRHKGFMRFRQRRLPQADPPPPAQAIDEPVTGHRQKPGGEGTLGVIALPDRMEGQQDILHAILDLLGAEARPARHPPEIRRDRAQQRAIGLRIAVLGGGHQRRPILVGRRCRRGIFDAHGSRV